MTTDNDADPAGQLPPFGLYLNLDRSADRRTLLEAHLTELGLADRYQRFQAIDGFDSPRNPDVSIRPELGCYLSHLEAIRSSAGSKQWLHIIEDDSLISRFFKPIINQILAQDQYSDFDVIFTNVMLPLDSNITSGAIRTFENNVATDPSGFVIDIKVISVMLLAGIDFMTASSYLINPKSIERVTKLLDRRLNEKPFVAIDIAFPELARSGELKIGCTIPFLTLFQDTHTLDSTIRTSAYSPWRESRHIMAAALYADRDPLALDALLQQLEPQSRKNVTTDLIGRAYQYSIGADPTY